MHYAFYIHKEKTIKAEMKFLHLLYLQYIDLIITLLYQHMLRAKN